MGLEDDLKARTSALVSQQMANWVVEIQRAIQAHQATLVRALDELGETVARYDEKVDDSAIGAAMAEVLSRQGGRVTNDYSGLKSSIAAIEKGANLSEVLTHLVTEVNRYIERVAIFIVKSNAAVGWYARGFDRPEVVKTLSIPLTADTVFRVVSSSRRATRGHVTHSPGTSQALGKLGGDPQGILAVPLILRDKVAAVLYCDTTQEEVPQGAADMVEILVTFAGKVIDVLSGGARPAASATHPGTGPQPAIRPTTGPVAVPSIAPAAEPSASSTVMWTAGTSRPPLASPRTPPLGTSAPPTPAPSRSPFASAPAPAAVATPNPPPVSGATPRIAPDDQKAHDDAKRFARLVVSEIKLYNEAKVTEGRKTKDIYERLKEDIERGRQMYRDRVPAHVRDATDYFQDELVRILAGGDATALGAM